MGQVIDLRTAAAGFKPAACKQPRRSCPRCGADLWHLLANGEICCADCEAVCPYRLQSKQHQ